MPCWLIENLWAFFPFQLFAIIIYWERKKKFISFHSVSHSFILSTNINLLIDALNNLNGFFDNLATNIHTMESRNLLPNQMRLLGESEYRPRDPYGHSAAFINSVSFIFNCLMDIFINPFKKNFFRTYTRFAHIRHQKTLENFSHISQVMSRIIAIH